MIRPPSVLIPIIQELYTQCLAGASQDKTIYSNRSLARLKLLDYEGALADAEKALEVGEPHLER